MVTPEYNHSYPGTLKNLIDLHHTQWQAKPVGFVSYGGISGGLRAVEHLRPVFAELHAVTVRDSVAFPNPWPRFDPTGTLLDPDAAETAAATMLDQLTWWAEALRTARATHPLREVNRTHRSRLLVCEGGTDARARWMSAVARVDARRRGFRRYRAPALSAGPTLAPVDAIHRRPAVPASPPRRGVPQRHWRVC